MATLSTSTELKIDSTIMQCIPVLKGQSNYSIWKTCVQSVLQAYLIFEFVDSSLLYTAMTSATDQQKWKMLDHRVLGFITGLSVILLSPMSTMTGKIRPPAPQYLKHFGRNSNPSLGLQG